MAYELPPVLEKQLHFDWFPTPAQCLIYRNWETVPAGTLAKILQCDEATVLSMAEDMGLDPNVTVSNEWLTRGYITLIRNNWYLLDYDGLCTLLGWSRDYLAFILKEDDFLDIKLGKTPETGPYKPQTPDLTLRPLTEEEKRRTAEIREVTLSLRRELPAPTVAPFDFFAGMENDTESSTDGDESIFKHRVIYSYCALYGDTFLDRELIDVSFPDEMLSRYKAVGINGVWTQMILSKVAPYPFDPAASEGYEKRLEGMRYLTEKLERYGIKLYLYINEPRVLPDTAFDAFPHLRGMQYGGNNTALCIQTEEVQRYLRESVAFVVRSVPKLGGFFTITASENQTNCYSHVKGNECNCPRCRDKSREELFALANRLIAEGARSANSDIKVWAYTWAWYQGHMNADEIAAMMPKEIGLLAVSEEEVHKTVQGTDTFVRDYSISVEGPGEIALDTWRAAKETGREALAKVQLNNSWELSTVPCLPVFDKVYRHLKGIAESGNVSGLLMSWTLGGYPSPTLEIVKAFSAADGRIPTLREIYERIFPNTDVETLASAFTAFSDAFDEYPFAMRVAYYGPQHMGPANLLYAEKTGFNASMVCYPHDDLAKWRTIYSEQGFFNAFDAICQKWVKGFEYLDRLDCEHDPKLRFLSVCAHACYLHFCSSRNQIKYLMEGTTLAEKQEILADEQRLARELIKLMGEHAALGYEASNHYFFTRQSLLEKIVNCEYLKKTLC